MTRVALIAAVILAVACQRPDPAPAELGRIAPVSLVDQDGHPFGKRELADHVWITALMFTSCTMACPRMAERLAYVQSKLPAHADAIRLLSITVDAENDTPKVLRAFAGRYHRDPGLWTYVTGETDPVFGSVNAAYKEAFGAKANLNHGETLTLLDGEGRIVGFYGKDDASVARLLADADRLAAAHARTAGL